jgi:anti-anti-sigma regulatory factor
VIVRTELAGGILTVYLPESLVAETRGAMVDALSLALERRGVASVRLDASALVTLDGAGIGALVRAARITREHTGERLVLAHCAPAVVEALTATAVLPLVIDLEM